VARECPARHAQINWNNPDQLYGIIVQSLTDGFRRDVLDAARHLYEIDTLHVRAACIWGIVLMEEGRLDEAESVFEAFLARRGEDGVILTNLAKVYSRRKDDAQAEKTLWRALEIDPNQDNGLGWYLGIFREREGGQAAIDALSRIAVLPNSWRAQLWLARNALQALHLDEALTLYREGIAHAPKPVPADLLMQMSGDLGNSGHSSEIVQLCGSHFVPEIHGLLVGNNLLKAHVDLGRFDSASSILNQLYALKRPDWQQTLSFWDTEIAKARLAKAGTGPAGIEATMLFGEGPVWLKPQSPGAELFPPRETGEIGVCLLGSSAESDSGSQQIVRQLSDTRGRLSRAIPLFLAEKIYFASSAPVYTMVPWLVNGGAGFILSGVAWADADAVKYARQCPVVSNYVVTTHLKCQNEPWTLELRLLRASDGKCLDNLSVAFPSAEPGAAVLELSRDLLTALVDQAGIRITPVVSTYQVPVESSFPSYLLRLEQLLAVRCSAMDHVPAGFLSGEREMIDGNIQLCIACPRNVITRLVLAKTLLGMKNVRPDIPLEFADKIAALQRELPLPQPAHRVIQKMLEEAVASA
jgi:tetratricopeptide (TPR) repeat protein